MKVILDSAVFMHASSFPFTDKDEYVMPSRCEEEVKERAAKLRLEVALALPNLSITDPCPATIEAVRRLATKHGDTRLSEADEQVIGLALEAVSRKEKVLVYTDDYSIQNILTWRKIPFSGVAHKGISKPRSFAKRRKS